MPLINNKFEPLELPEKHAHVLFDNSKKWRYRVLWGGRNGYKDWSMTSAIIEIAVRKPIRVLCTREVQNTIADSIKKLLEDTIYRLGYGKYFSVTNDKISGVNGSTFIFKGLKDMNAENIKSIEGIDYVIIGEAQSLTYQSFSVLDPTIRKPGSEIWIQFNQKQGKDFVYERFVKNPPDNAIVGAVCYLDAPYASEEIINQANLMKQEDEPMYRHVWLFDLSPVGQFFGTFGKHMCIEPYHIQPGTRLYGSLDHGTTAATSFGLWFIDNNKKPVRIFTYYQAGRSASENAYAIARMIQGFDLIGSMLPDVVYADPAMWTKIKLDKDFQPSAIDYYISAFNDVFNGYKEYPNRVMFEKANNDIPNGCVAMREFFGSTDGVPNSFYFDKYNKPYEELIPIQENDKYNPEIYDTRLEDHIADDTRYFFMGIKHVVDIAKAKENSGTVVDHEVVLALMGKRGMIGETGL